MEAYQAILEEQRKRVMFQRWDETGSYSDYLSDYTNNFIYPLPPEIEAAYRDGAGSEIPPDNDGTRGYRLYHGKKVPAKMQAIHSSSALVCNAFAYWYEQTDRSPLQKALGCKDKISKIVFEGRKPTGLGGIPPHLDVVLYSDSMVYAIESKFSEPYQEDKKKIVMGSKRYLPALWQNKGLYSCANLVDKINNGAMDGKFRFLSANQLLKHILGLSHNHGNAFELFYLWYEKPGTVESDAHRSEINDFAIIVGSEVAFKAITYQEFYDKVEESSVGQHSDYLERFSQRYI